MTMVDTGTTGAKRQSWHAANPRDLLKQLVERHPNWNKERLLREFTDNVVDNRKYMDAIIEYWFANNYHSLVERPPQPSAHKARKERSVGALTMEIEAAVERKAEIKLLEMIMPNGKPLRDCTGGECIKLSSKIGGWLLRISKRVSKNQTVGEALNETQVRELYSKS